MNILTVEEVADLLRIKPSTVYAWAAQKKIPSVKMFGALKFEEEEIIKWFEACKQPAEEYNNSRR